MEEVDGLKFVLDRELVNGLDQHLPFQVDYDDRSWFGVRVQISRKIPGCEPVSRPD